MTTHEPFIDQRLDYTAGLLDEGERQAFERHLAGCEECQLEVARIETDLRWLPMGAAPLAPSAGFARRAVSRVVGGRRPARSGWLAPAALAASALLVAGGWWLGRSQVSGLQRELRQQHALAAALRDTLSIMRGGRVLQADVEVGNSRGGVLIFADEVTHRWNVVVHGLPPAPPGYRYQFWFVCADGATDMVRGTAIAADASRPTMFTTDMPQPQACPTVRGAALTEEPMAETQGPPRGKALAHLML
jgi:hypothetical protein